MFGRKENNKIIFKVQNNLTAETFVDFIKFYNKLAIAFPNVTVCVELEGDFVKSAEEHDDEKERDDYGKER